MPLAIANAALECPKTSTETVPVCPLLVELLSFTVKLPLCKAPTVVPVKYRPPVAPLVPVAVTATGPEMEPATFEPLATVKERSLEFATAELTTLKVKPVLPPVMMELAAGVAVMVPMIALCCKSSSAAEAFKA